MIVIEIFDLPKLPNQIRMSHWRVKQAETRKWWDLVHLKTYKLMQGIDQPMNQVEIQYERYSSREPDYDNLVASFKPVTDALIKVGLILDDNPKVVVKSSYRWFKCARKDVRTIVRITSI